MWIRPSCKPNMSGVLNLIIIGLPSIPVFNGFEFLQIEEF